MEVGSRCHFGHHVVYCDSTPLWRFQSTYCWRAVVSLLLPQRQLICASQWSACVGKRRSGRPDRRHWRTVSHCCARFADTSAQFEQARLDLIARSQLRRYHRRRRRGSKLASQVLLVCVITRWRSKAEQSGEVSLLRWQSGSPEGRP